jgi:carboxymethylenebutenolidase
MPAQRSVPLITAAFISSTLMACAQRTRGTDEHAEHAATAAAAQPAAAAADVAAAGKDSALPPSDSTVATRLAASPRHGEYVMIAAAPGSTDSIRLWVVYPERSTKAPVVVVIHEIFGLSGWVRGVADQLAHEGYIAIAPDLLTGKKLPGAPDNVPIDTAVAAIRTLDPANVRAQILAAARYGTSLPAALPQYGVIGFCWGGAQVFAVAATDPDLDAAVAYYGAAPVQQVQLSNTKAPVLALYGGNDARVDATIPAADSGLKAAGATFEKEIYPGAGHGFLRQQSGQNGANLAATRAAWPRTVAFFRQHLGA